MKTNFFKNKTILITGGTGSFGSAFLNLIINDEIREIRIFSRDEKKQEDMRKKYNQKNLKFYLGDVRDYESISGAMIDVDYVFHAAALKQVPSCEFYPFEAVKTNILGTENVIRASINYKIKKLVLLSTDKAVYPINAMGMSKALAEKIVLAHARINHNSSTIICATRYGNVMASRGSVIPLFINQINNGRDITITDPNMTRFLMSLQDSVKLVLFAFKNAKQGDLFVQKSPASNMGDLATAITEILNKKSKIKIIGTRHGEKLFETLISREEMARAEDLGNYYRIPNDNRDLNYDNYFVDGDSEVSEATDYTSHNTNQLKIPEIKKLLLSLNLFENANA